MNNIKLICKTGEYYIGELRDKTLVYSVDRIAWFRNKQDLLDMINQYEGIRIAA